LAIQILWINLVTDGLPAIALGFEPAEEGAMRRMPREKNESVFAGGVGRHIIIIGILIAGLTLGGYMWGYSTLGLSAFNPEQGIAEMSFDELSEMLGAYGFSSERITEELPTQDIGAWDELSVEERLSVLEGDSGEEGIELEGSTEGIVGLVERIPRSIAF